MSKKRKKINDLTTDEKIDVARYYFALFPAATKVYISLKTKIDYQFVSDNWNQITNIKSVMSKTFKPGDRVFYQRPDMIRPQNGIVKSAAPVPDHYFVVYHCAGDWEHYQNYTGQLCDSKHLSPGWPEINSDDTEF